MEKFKKGDIVICKSGYFNNNEISASDPLYGGAGYEDGKIFTITQITEEGAILWPPDDGCGIFAHCCSHVDPLKQITMSLREEIKSI